jgi:fructose-1,6-bisphosphatase I
MKVALTGFAAGIARWRRHGNGSGTAMEEHQTLYQHLADWGGDDPLKSAVATTIGSITEACCAIAEIIALGPLAGPLEAGPGQRSEGDAQAELDRRANRLLMAELKSAPVACLAAEEFDLPDAFDSNAPLCVAIDPVDGSSKIDTNAPVGTIFSIFPMVCQGCVPRRECFAQKGRRQLAAGYVMYGPRTALLLTLGDGTHRFTLNPDTGEFCLTEANVRIPEDTDEFAINTANFRRWDGHLRAYIDDCLKGAEGPHGKNYNTRWIESLVAECHRIMVRGGIFLYPGDRRPDYRTGRLRLAFECNPIAFLVEQAGGAASTGHEPILDVQPTDIHERAPLIFGSRNEVHVLEHYYREAHPYHERPQLFGDRGLFRTG